MRKTAVIIVCVILILGCGLLGREEKNEKKVLGSTDGYNAQVKQVQDMLKKNGFNPGPVDGKLGWRTREAIRDFQRKNNLIVNGYIDERVFAKLDNDFQKTVVSRESFLAGKNAGAKETIQSCLTSSECIKKAQQALKINGFNPGPIDGKIGPQTRKAVADFQKAKRLVADGSFTVETWQVLSEYFP